MLKRDRSLSMVDWVREVPLQPLAGRGVCLTSALAAPALIGLVAIK